MYYIRLAVTILAIAWVIILSPSSTQIANAVAASESVYQERTVHSPDGIGKFHMGREIAQAMGHQGALWLERPSRATEE